MRLELTIWDWITCWTSCPRRRLLPPLSATIDCPQLSSRTESCENSSHRLIRQLVSLFSLCYFSNFSFIGKRFFLHTCILIMVSAPITPPKVLPFFESCVGNNIIESSRMQLPCHVEDTISKRVPWFLRSFYPNFFDVPQAVGAGIVL